MTEINIAGVIEEINIFDDPEYCQGDHPKQCSYLSIYDSNGYNDEANCELILDDEGERTDLSASDENNKWMKCQQCKEAWNKASKKQISVLDFSNIYIPIDKSYPGNEC